ncbi:MAG: hypothetical protein J6039_06020, partial [Alphaproteobacteria bacterium]|nr:hypothetical protein [Alphaproteobacteria bacterium]
NNDIKYIITTSTLLQGVNIPAVKIFLFSNKCGRKNSYLSSSSFKNLIGRTCRFSEIFSPHNKDFNLLQPEIYIVKTTFFNSRTNIEDYISKVANMTKETKDDIKNEMLKEKNTEKYEKEIEYLENMERGTISKQTINICRTVIGKLCFENNVRDFEIIKNEETLNDNYTEYVISHNILISNEKDLLSAIFEIFLKNIETDKSQGENFVRLKDVKARNFYQMLLEWKINNYPYNRMIKHFLEYWKRKISNKDFIVYVGLTWGEVKRDPNDRHNLYINLQHKDDSDLVNLAIVKIKEEQDFIENHIIKYLEILHDLELIDNRFYEKVKYGSNDIRIITMLKNGFSADLANILIGSIYEKYITFNFETETLHIDKDIIHCLEENNVNDLFIFELKFHIKA